jgi:hypothetical protein
VTKVIEVIVSPSGETRVETKGFAGEECREASALLESALGKRSSESVTAEFYASQNTETQQQQKT